jgi:hypothetical protein
VGFRWTFDSDGNFDTLVVSICHYQIRTGLSSCFSGGPNGFILSAAEFDRLVGYLDTAYVAGKRGTAGCKSINMQSLWAVGFVLSTMTGQSFSCWYFCWYIDELS